MQNTCSATRLPSVSLSPATRLPRPRRRALRAAFLTAGAGMVALGARDARAASATWNTTTTDSNWVTSGSENNWSTGAATYPGSVTGTSSTDTATFSSATSNNTSITINSPTLNIGSITFSGSGQPAYTIGTVSGNSLLLTSGGQITDSATGSSGTATVNAPLILEPGSSTTAGTYSFNASTSSSSHVLVVGGAVAGGTTSQGITLTLTTGTTIPTTASDTITGNIGDGNAQGGVAVSKTAVGTWVLSGSNTYSGGTAISAGVLQINGAASLPTSGTVNVSVTGAELLLYNPAASTITGTYGGSGQSLLLNGVGTSANSGALRVDTASGGVLNATWQGAVTLGSSSIVTPTTGNSVTFSGNVTDNGNQLQKQGGGILTLSGANNSLTGSALIGNGTLKLANTAGNAVSGTYIVNVNNTGTLLMGAANQLNAAVAVNLTGTSTKAATFGVGGFNQGSTTASGVGALTLAASSANNVINFASVAGVVTFASLTTNGAILTISNYVNNNSLAGQSDELIFNQDESANLANIVFTGYGTATEQLVSGTAGTGNAFYEVFPTAVPEPATLFGGSLMVGLLAWNQRRRLGGLAGLLKQACVE